MDLGSAVLSAEMAIEYLMPEERRANVLLCEAPIVEGAVAAAVTAKLGRPSIASRRKRGVDWPARSLTSATRRATCRSPRYPPGAGEGAGAEGESIRLTVQRAARAPRATGGSLRPTVSSFDARVTIRDLTNGRGPADAASLNGVAMLGATQGHEVEVAATGRQATEALAAIHALADRDFDDRPEGGVGDALLSRRRSPPRTSRGSSAATPHRPASPSAPPGGSEPPTSLSRRVPARAPRAENAAFDAALAVVARRSRSATRAGRRAGRTPTGPRSSTRISLFLKDDALLGPTEAFDRRRQDRQHRHGTRRSNGRRRTGTSSRTSTCARERPTCEAWGDRCSRRLLGLPLPGPGAGGARRGYRRATWRPPTRWVLDPSWRSGSWTAAGGPTSHAAVLARSSGIPAVVGAR